MSCVVLVGTVLPCGIIDAARNNENTTQRRQSDRNNHGHILPSSHQAGMFGDAHRNDLDGDAPDSQQYDETTLSRSHASPPTHAGAQSLSHRTMPQQTILPPYEDSLGTQAHTQTHERPHFYSSIGGLPPRYTPTDQQPSLTNQPNIAHPIAQRTILPSYEDTMAQTHESSHAYLYERSFPPRYTPVNRPAQSIANQHEPNGRGNTRPAQHRSSDGSSDSCEEADPLRSENRSPPPSYTENNVTNIDGIPPPTARNSARHGRWTPPPSYASVSIARL